MKRAFGYSFNYWIELQEKSMSHSFKFAILEPALGLMKPLALPLLPVHISDADFFFTASLQVDCYSSKWLQDVSAAAAVIDKLCSRFD